LKISVASRASSAHAPNGAAAMILISQSEIDLRSAVVFQIRPRISVQIVSRETIRSNLATNPRYIKIVPRGTIAPPRSILLLPIAITLFAQQT
jgi:hypothetical protein